MKKHLAIILYCLLSTALTIDLLLISGDKLFNSNTPVLINIKGHNGENYANQMDIVCVIDTSKNMSKENMEKFKNSFMMFVRAIKYEDQISIVLYDENSHVLLPFKQRQYLNKKEIDHKIYEIEETNKSPNMLNGLKQAIHFIKNEKNSSNPQSAHAIFLFTAGPDSLSNSEILEGFEKEIGDYNRFTVYTFGLGNRHDSEFLSAFAHKYDGNYYHITSMDNSLDIMTHAINALNSHPGREGVLTVNSVFPIKKLYGINQLFTSKLTDNQFVTTSKYFGGRNYTFVMEVDVPNTIQLNEEILSVTLTYKDYKITPEKDGNEYSLTSKLLHIEQMNNDQAQTELTYANEQNIKAQLYDSCGKAIEYLNKEMNDEAMTALTTMETWIKENYKGKDKTHLQEITSAIQAAKNYKYDNGIGKSYLVNLISENMFLRGGASMKYRNKYQIIFQDILDVAKKATYC